MGSSECTSEQFSSWQGGGHDAALPLAGAETGQEAASSHFLGFLLPRKSPTFSPVQKNLQHFPPYFISLQNRDFDLTSSLNSRLTVSTQKTICKQPGAGWAFPQPEHRGVHL